MADNDSDQPCGWKSSFPKFRDTSVTHIRQSLVRFLRDASDLQHVAWDESIPLLQREVGEACAVLPRAEEYTTILEYQMPLESRRADVVLLVRGAVIVLELKGKAEPSQADLDQASAYARDLSNYHRVCAELAVHVVVVPTEAEGCRRTEGGIYVAGPAELDVLIRELDLGAAVPAPSARDFLAEDAYQPLPSLVRAARELFTTGDLRKIKRANSATEPARSEIARIIREAASTKTRRLVLVTGLPGSGKTLVGLQVVHSHELDDLAVERKGRKPTVPAVFLSGNAPLVAVLQYELRSAGGDGKTFVRGVKEYVAKYSKKKQSVPPEHVLVFDEAQRAWDRDMVAEKHPDEDAKSEPEHFIDFASRIPDWCVVIGLIGTGQEIHVGEEAGLVQWRHAIEGSSAPDAWSVHAPKEALTAFAGASVRIATSPELSLDTELRYHLASDVHRYVELLLADGDHAGECSVVGHELEEARFHLRITRDLDIAKRYLRDRYADNADARFGLLASSRDKALEELGVPNGFNATRKLPYGAWYGEGERDARSCRRLQTVATEFAAQGMELDGALLAWGTDFMRSNRVWNTDRSRKYQARKQPRVKSNEQLRRNAYRVLLTRGRDGTVAWVPDLRELDETYAYLVASGFARLP